MKDVSTYVSSVGLCQSCRSLVYVSFIGFSGCFLVWVFCIGLIIGIKLTSHKGIGNGEVRDAIT